MPNPWRNEMLSLQRRGLTLREIGEKYGIHRLMVYEILSGYWEEERMKAGK